MGEPFNCLAELFKHLAGLFKHSAELLKPTLRENQRLGREFKKPGQVFKKLDHMSVLTQPMLSQPATVEHIPKQLQTFDKVNEYDRPMFNHSEFDISFWSFVVKIFVTELSFCNLMLGEWRIKISSPTKIVLAHKTIYFSQLVKAYSLPKAIVSQAQLAFFCPNPAIMTVVQSVEIVQS